MILRFESFELDCTTFELRRDGQLLPLAPQPARLLALLAVLPFENLGSDPSRDYVADGLTEELITELGRIDPEHLGLIARGTAMQYRTTDKRLSTIAEELDVRFLVEGSLRHENGRLRVTSRPVDWDGEVQKWADSFDLPAENVLLAQSELASRVAAWLSLELRLSPSSSGPQHEIPSRAYESYLKAKYNLHQGTPESYLAARYVNANVDIRVDG